MIEAKRGAIEALLQRAAGFSVGVDIEVEARAAPDDSGQEAPAQAERGPAPTEEEHPLVRRAAELFGARVVHVAPLAQRTQ
jgi:hypothetical protein